MASRRQSPSPFFLRCGPIRPGATFINGTNSWQLRNRSSALMASRAVIPLLLLTSQLEIAASASTIRSVGAHIAAEAPLIPSEAAPTPHKRSRSFAPDISLDTSFGAAGRALSDTSAKSDSSEDGGSFFDFVDQTESQSSSLALDDDDADEGSGGGSVTILAGSLVAVFLVAALGGFYWYVRKNGDSSGGGGGDKNETENGRPEGGERVGGAGGGRGESVSGPRAVKPSRSVRRLFMAAPSVKSPVVSRTPTDSSGSAAGPPTTAMLGAVGSEFLAPSTLDLSERVSRARSGESSKTCSSDSLGGHRTCEGKRSSRSEEQFRESRRGPKGGQDRRRRLGTMGESSSDHVLGRKYYHGRSSEKKLSTSSSTLQTSFASSASSSSFSSSFSSSSSSFSEASEQENKEQHQKFASRRGSATSEEDPYRRPDFPLPRPSHEAQRSRDHYGRVSDAADPGAHRPSRQQQQEEEEEELALNNLGRARKFTAPAPSTPAARKFGISGQFAVDSDEVFSPERTNDGIFS